ncbi:VgrG-related protein [Kitasatospora sp. GAS204B]|uniref:VgrG-related protein n=1 Tax=unclassified Kitasatospora TaxID=2633591 RepID=UPI0024770165|nr:VgrG-related protein [Kitasatospora sp. GAS204B]MDH6118866.1 phage protein D [Kitasatospora sp. GAS204B]
MGADTSGFEIGVPGALPPVWDSAPMDILVEEGGGLAAVAVVRFLDPSRALLAQTGITIGALFTIQAKRDSGSPLEPLFTGEVVALEAEFDGAGSFTTVRAMDVSHRLRRGRRIAGYPQSTASDIAAEVAEKAGIGQVQIDATTMVYPYATQPNVSDWDFLQGLALENDREMVVENGIFHFRKPVAATGAPDPSTDADKNPFVVELGKTTRSVRAAATSVNQVSAVEARGWDVGAKKAVGYRAPVVPSVGQQLGLTPAAATAKFPPADLVVADVPYGTDAEVTAVATALAAENAAALGEFEICVDGNPQLRVGTPVALGGAGTPFDGRYTITAVSHSYLRGLGYETRVTVSGRQDRTLFGLATGASAPARSPRVPSVAIGVVVDVLRPGQIPADGYGEQAKQGWVKLKFPWLSDSPAEGTPVYVTDWVRTVQLGGVGGGGLFCPEIDDEVLVAFEQGLLDRPVVLGGLYNGKDSPSPASGQLIDPSGKVAGRTLSSRNGDRLELQGAMGEGKGVLISTGDNGLTVRLDRQQTEITVDSKGKVTIRGATGITLDAGAGPLSLSGGSVSIKGEAEVSVNAPLIKLN